MKTLQVFILSLLSAALLFSCQQKPGGTEAEVSEAQEVEEVSASAADYSVNTSESKLMWYGFKPTGRHNGTIAIQGGTISVLNGEIEGGSFTMDMNAIDVEDLEGEDEQKLAGHLKSPDFFSVEEYPTATFEITGVEAYSGEMAAAEGKMAVVVNDEEVDEYSLPDPTHSITGNLTMRGTTLGITFPAKVSMTDGQVTAEAKFNIDRSKWGVNFREENGYEARAKDELIYDTVHVGFDITASGGEPTAMAK